MNLTATLTRHTNELCIVATDERDMHKKKMLFNIEELPYIGMFEYQDEIYDIELQWNGLTFDLWVGQDRVMQEYELNVM